MRVRRGLPVNRGTEGASAGTPLALTVGNFDGVHRAHRAMLERTVDAATDLELTPAVLTFHPSPKEFFALRSGSGAGDGIIPRLSTLTDKLEQFREAGIREVIVARFNAALAAQSADDFVRSVLQQQLGVRWLLVGDDFRFGNKRAGTIETLRASKTFTVERMNTVVHAGERVSSSAVRAALQAGDLDAATRLLGRPYSITGRVAHGEKLGRSIGFPTANLPLRFTPPLAGICAVEVTGLGPTTKLGVASIGTRPTVNATTRPILEVFLFDFDEDIYGRRITVHFLHKLRDEARYSDVDTLRAQIARDADDAREWLDALGARKRSDDQHAATRQHREQRERSPRIASPAGPINA
jgi:riboflavin kinase/FMN adenylyltransferase